MDLLKDVSFYWYVHPSYYCIDGLLGDRVVMGNPDSVFHSLTDFSFIDFINHCDVLDTGNEENILEFCSRWGLFEREDEIFLSHIIACIDEIRLFINSGNSSVVSLRRDIFSYIETALYHTVNLSLSNSVGSQLRSVYRVMSLRGLVAFCFYRMLLSGIFFRRCKECGKLFIPARRDAEFCRDIVTGKSYCAGRYHVNAWRERKKRENSK